MVNVYIDESVVEMISAGDAPIHEERLAELITKHADTGGTDGTGRLCMTTDCTAVFDTEVILHCLPAPQREEDSIDRGS
jgi:UDP-glucose 6-dehydrogenase